ncbi:hypothetical protein SKAU_G00029680 [Synaphobranchus kaupii]|uniref:Uncharacterized protein n=1 Tax=Synaphobranchus kaupii TaxID=118154 RepID=A0A9Q1GDI3_SYNKA|nr:hypothetical protein SKAU_G00029680 [Synaphobranchus kaupii]
MLLLFSADSNLVMWANSIPDAKGMEVLFWPQTVDHMTLRTGKKQRAVALTAVWGLQKGRGHTVSMAADPESERKEEEKEEEGEKRPCLPLTGPVRRKETRLR